MRRPSGELHVVDFKTSQIITTIQPDKYWDDKRHWEIKNGIDMLDFKVPMHSEESLTLQQQNIVLKEVRDGVIVPYVITSTEKDSSDGSVSVYVSGEWVLLDKAGYITPQRLESKTLQEFIDLALTGTNWKVGNIPYAGFHTMTIDEFISPLKLLVDTASLFDLEIVYRVSVLGSQIIGRYVDMVEKRGMNTGKEIIIGKDLQGVRRIENSEQICTALVGFLRTQGEDGKDSILTIESINNGSPYLVDEDAYQRWNENGQHRFGFYTPESSDNNMSPQRLKILMENELEKRINASVSYEVDVISLGKVFGLDHEMVNEGDVVRIIDTTYNPTLYLEARVIAGDESFKDPRQDKYIFGDYRELTDPNANLMDMYRRIMDSLGNKANQDVVDQLDKLAKEAEEKARLAEEAARKAAEDAQKAMDTANEAKEESKIAKDIADQVENNLKNYQTTIIKSPTAPTQGLEANKTLWLDLSDGYQGILKLWDGMQWNPIVPDTSGLEQDINDARNDIKSINDEITQVGKEIKDIQDEVANLPDSQWINKQLEGKANKEDVYTKDYVDNNLVGKQVYETDKQGNIKKFTDMQTEINQNAEEITKKASKTDLTQVSDKVTAVDKTVNEVKQTAGENSSKITNINTKFDNMKIGAENYIINSSANNEYPAMYNDKHYEAGRSTVGFFEDYLILTCNNSSDAYYQMGKTTTNDRRGFKIGEPITVSFDLQMDISGVQFTLFQYINGGWIEHNAGVYTARDWQRYSHTFSLSEGCQGWMLRFRFPRVADTAGKRIRFKNILLEKANKASEWHRSSYDLVTINDFTKTTNEIKQTVTENSSTITELRTQVDNQKSTGINLLKNTDFLDVTEWQNAKVNEKDFQGMNSVTNIRTNWVEGMTRQQVTQYNENLPNVSTGAEYTASLWVYVDSSVPHNGTGSNNISLRTFKASDNTIYDYTIGYLHDIPMDEWVFISKTISLANDVIPRYGFLVSLAQNGLVKMAMPMFELGNIASGWALAPNEKNTKDEFRKTTNEIKQTIDSNSATITQITGKLDNLQFGSENYIINSSANQESPAMYDDKYGGGNRVSAGFYEDYMILTCTDSADAYYQLGLLTTNSLRGFKVDEPLTFSFELNTGISGVMSTLFQYINGQWVEHNLGVYQSGTWKRYEHTFSITKGATGWMLRFRFPRVAESKDSKMRVKNLLLEKGSVASPWHRSSYDLVTNTNFTKTTNEIKQTVEENTSTITKIRNDQGTMQKDISEIKQTSSELSTKVSNITKVQTDQGVVIADHESRIKQNAQEIGTKVSGSEMRDYVGGVGTTNLMINTQFVVKTIDKNGVVTSSVPSLNSWSKTGTGDIRAVDTRRIESDHTVYINSTGNTSDGEHGIYQFVPVKGGENLVTSLYTFTTNKAGVDRDATISVRFYNGNTVISSVGKSLTLTNNVWVRTELPFTVPANTTRILFVFSVRRNGEIWLGHPSVQTGKTASGYFPNPKDWVDYDDTIKKIADKVATEDFNKVTTSMQTEINQNKEQIDLRAKRTDVYTKKEADDEFADKAYVVDMEARIKINADNISQTVRKSEVISSINQSAETIQIQAQRINLVGYVTAQHIKGQVLEGVTLRTVADPSFGRYVEINKQNIRLFDSNRTARGYWGFFDRTDGGLQPTFVLGKDASAGYNLNGSLVCSQITPKNAAGGYDDWRSVAEIGIVASYNATNGTFYHAASIEFVRNGSHMYLSADGEIQLNSQSAITLRASGSRDILINSDNSVVINGSDKVELTSINGQNFYDARGEFQFSNPRYYNNPPILLRDDGANADLRLAQARLRSSHASGYTGFMQVKDRYGSNYAGLEAGFLRAKADGANTGNISADGSMYSKGFINTSSRRIKSNIRDLDFSALDKVMGLQVKKYNYKTEVAKLYEMRMNKEEGAAPYTTEDIKEDYGLIVEDTDKIFTDEDGKGINLYATLSMTVAALQESENKNQELRNRVDQLEALVMQLVEKGQ